MTDSASKKCQYCGEMVLVEAKKCKHCGEILDPQMREIENLKNMQKNQSGNVYMNSAASSPVGLRPFNHGLHIILSILSAGLWLIVYIPLYIFRNKSIYY